MKLMWLIVSSELLLMLLRDGVESGVEVVSDRIPEDARLYRADITERGDVVLFIESDAFGEVPYGELVPMLSPVFKRRMP